MARLGEIVAFGDLEKRGTLLDHDRHNAAATKRFDWPSVKSWTRKSARPACWTGCRPAELKPPLDIAPFRSSKFSLRPKPQCRARQT